MEFYDDALIVLQRPCGDPRCGLLHPEIVKAEFIGVVVHEDEALVAVVQKKSSEGGEEVYMTLILEPESIGYLMEENDRLCIVLNQLKIREPMMMVKTDPEELKETLRRDEAYLHGALFGRIKVPGDEGYEGELPPSAEVKDETPEDSTEDPTGLKDLDPTKMHQA